MTMWTDLARLWPRPARNTGSARRSFRLWLEELESRVVPSAADGNSPVVAALSVSPTSPDSLPVTFDGPVALDAALTPTFASSCPTPPL